MKVCILGGGLTSLTLAKALAKQDICVDIFFNQKIKRYNNFQTLGISKTNIEFLNNNILNIQELLWNINKIEIYNENFKNEKLLDFENKNKTLFSTIKNYELYDSLFSKLNKDKLIKFKNKFNYDLKKKEYKLIFNCDPKNSITKFFFNKKIDKDYKSSAYTTIIKHKGLSNNNVATQIFTKIGPIAFLPISSTETSVVYSIRGIKNVDLEKLIKKYNIKYKILKINEVLNFKLKLSNLRIYHYKNIIAFGDLLHKIHPLAGQGFNMSIRDIKEIIKLIKFKKYHGLDLDSSICFDFEKHTKHKNYLFSQGIDFIYELFKLESKIDSPFFTKTIQLIGKNRITNKLFSKFADKGIEI